MKLSTVALIMSLLFSINTYSSVGFKSGNDFKAHSLRGSFNLTCSSGSERRSVLRRCGAYFLSPSNRAKFITDSGVDAKKVTLRRVNSKGKIIKKKSKFKPSTGESKKSFNLWLRSLTQRPLLTYGENIISYELTGNEVEKGEFIVNVEKMATKTCRHDSYRVYNMSYCSDPNGYCSQYFRDHNFCN